MNFFLNLFKPKQQIVPTEITKRFDLIGRVGQGSMSKVWRATDSLSGKTVALKILDKEKTIRFEERFPDLKKPTEGEVAVSLDHSNIVKTYEHGITTDKEQFLVMEFVEGISLSFLVDVQNEKMKQGRLRYLIELGNAIEHFHQQNWIHRDICPRNILVDKDDHIKLIDFGLAVPNTADFQKPGNRTGTANYMAPELIKRQPTNQRIDIYSYAVTAYEMYTKQLPWESTGESFDMVVKHINQPPRNIRDLCEQNGEQIDEQVADAIMRGLEANPKNRWKTVAKMVQQFEEAADRQGTGSHE